MFVCDMVVRMVISTVRTPYELPGLHRYVMDLRIRRLLHKVALRKILLCFDGIDMFYSVRTLLSNVYAT